MRAQQPTSRTTSLVATATTLAALVAVAASAAAMPAPESRAVSETQRACSGVASVRMMAAVAYVMARDAIGGDQQTTSSPSFSARATLSQTPAPCVDSRDVPLAPRRAGPVLSLLDLPPPIC